MEGKSMTKRKLIDKATDESLAVLEEFLTIVELCNWLKVKRTTIYDYTYRKKIPFRRVGRSLRFPIRWIELWLKNPEETLRQFFDNLGGDENEYQKNRPRAISATGHLDRGRAKTRLSSPVLRVFERSQEGRARDEERSSPRSSGKDS